jgi:hypothetical protein
MEFVSCFVLCSKLKIDSKENVNENRAITATVLQILHVEIRITCAYSFTISLLHSDTQTYTNNNRYTACPMHFSHGQSKQLFTVIKMCDVVKELAKNIFLVLEPVLFV